MQLMVQEVERVGHDGMVRQMAGIISQFHVTLYRMRACSLPGML